MSKFTRIQSQVKIIQIPNSRLSAHTAGILQPFADEVLKSGHSALLVDLSAVAHITHCGLAALIEFFSAFGRNLHIGFCQLRPKVRSMIDRFSMSRSLPIYIDVNDALMQQEFRQCSLSGTRAVILCAGKGTRMAPLSWDTPKPMLDVLGRPILEHLLLHLEQFGVRDVWLNPGHLGDQIITRFRGPNKQNILFSNEGYYSDDGWEGVPLGSASTLAKLQRDNSAFVDDFIVICGDALIDLDFSKMMTCHKSSQAHITIATKSVASYDTGKYGIVVTDENGCVTDFQEKPSPDQAASNIASTGIYIISPDALEFIGREANQDIAQHLLPSLLRNGAKIQSFQEDFGWHDMGCGRDYAQVLSSALNGEIPGLDINGTEIAPRVWAAEDTDVSAKAHIAGPCYIGAGSVIRATARLEGPCILGPNCRVEAGARLQNIILHSDTAIRSDSEVSHHILSPFWAIETDKADGRTTATEPLDNVTRSSVPETFKPYWFGFGKVG